MGRTSTEKKNEWNQKTYERINFVVKAGDKEKLKAAAEAEGKSINRFIQEAINQKSPGLLSLMDDESKRKRD